MTRQLRAIVLTAAVALAFLAAVNVGAAKPDARQFQNLPPCAAGQQPTPQNPCMPSGGFPQGGGQGLPMCQPGQQPTPEAPCNTGGMPQGGQQGGMPQGGQQGGMPQGGQQGGMPQGGINWAELAPCAPGQVPSPQAPCKFDIQPCAEGQKPSPQAPCRPQGMPGREGEEMGGFDAPPTGDIQKDMKNKFMVIDINVQGSGEENGSFDVTFRKVVEGVGKQTKEYLNSQLEGESFVIQATNKTVCFADTKDADKVPDVVSCKELDDAANNAPGSIRAQFRGKVNFDMKTFSPKFTAQKIVFLKGSFNVAKID